MVIEAIGFLLDCGSFLLSELAANVRLTLQELVHFREGAGVLSAEQKAYVFVSGELGEGHPSLHGAVVL